jgi:hypothetical protein
MSTVIPMPAPKRASHTHNGKTIAITYHPHDPVTKRWHWSFKYETTMTFEGTAATLEAAKKQAVKQIEKLPV